MKMVTTFPDHSEYDKAMSIIKSLHIPFESVDPLPAYSLVGISALVLDEENYRVFTQKAMNSFVCSGWVDFRETEVKVPENAPRTYKEDLFGPIRIVSLQPCVADIKKLRIMAKFPGDISKVLPYLNSDMPNGMYISDASIFSYLDSFHMISLYPQKISIAKTEDIKDTWACLEKIRNRLNDVWSRKDSINPSYQMRKKPPALEIFKRLPAKDKKFHIYCHKT